MVVRILQARRNLNCLITKTISSSNKENAAAATKVKCIKYQVNLTSYDIYWTKNMSLSKNNLNSGNESNTTQPEYMRSFKLIAYICGFGGGRK